jgi:transposase
VLLNYIPYLGPQLIIILDNAFIYKLVYLQELCKHSGVILEFLPLYSPDFNPIEAIFKDLKAWIKRNYTLASRFKSFNNFLKFAIG